MAKAVVDMAPLVEAEVFPFFELIYISKIKGGYDSGSSYRGGGRGYGSGRGGSSYDSPGRGGGYGGGGRG